MLFRPEGPHDYHDGRHDQKSVSHCLIAGSRTQTPNLLRQIKTSPSGGCRRTDLKSRPRRRGLPLVTTLGTLGPVRASIRQARAKGFMRSASATEVSRQIVDRSPKPLRRFVNPVKEGFRAGPSLFRVRLIERGLGFGLRTGETMLSTASGMLLINRRLSSSRAHQGAQKAFHASSASIVTVLPSRRT